MDQKLPVCPRCEGYIPNNETPGLYPGAVSRLDNKTEICSACGQEEALQDWSAYESRTEIKRLRNALAELRDGDRFGIEAKYFAEHVLNGGN